MFLISLKIFMRINSVRIVSFLNVDTVDSHTE